MPFRPTSLDTTDHHGATWVCLEEETVHGPGWKSMTCSSQSFLSQQNKQLKNIETVFVFFGDLVHRVIHNLGDIDQPLHPRGWNNLS